MPAEPQAACTIDPEGVALSLEECSLTPASFLLVRCLRRFLCVCLCVFVRALFLGTVFRVPFCAVGRSMKKERKDTEGVQGRTNTSNEGTDSAEDG